MVTVTIPLPDVTVLLWIIAVGIFTHLGYYIYESKRQQQYQKWATAGAIVSKVVDWSIMSGVIVAGCVVWDDFKHLAVKTQDRLNNMGDVISTVVRRESTPNNETKWWSPFLPLIVQFITNKIQQHEEEKKECEAIRAKITVLQSGYPKLFLPDPSPDKSSKQLEAIYKGYVERCEREQKSQMELRNKIAAWKSEHPSVDFKEYKIDLMSSDELLDVYSEYIAKIK